MGAPVRAVLFDAAGTLIRTAEPVGQTYARVARAHGVEIPAWRMEDAFQRVHRGAPPMTADPERERDWWRQRVHETVRAADSEARFPDFDAYFSTLFDHYATRAAWEARDGASEALDALRARGLALAVVSNLDGRLAGILDALGIRVATVVRPADAGAAKPDARIFAYALARLGVDAAEAVFVGDDAERDVAAAVRVGLRAIDVAELATLADLPRRITELEDE